MSVLDRVRQVKGPQPVLSRDREAALTERQRQLLDQLSAIFDEGFLHLTMSDLARRLNCSLRTLYGLAPSRDELVLLVADRNLWRVGRAAMGAIADDMSPVAAIRSYLTAAHVAVANTTEQFAHDCEATEATRHVQDLHAAYLVDVTRTLLDLATEQGLIVVVDTAAASRVIARIGTDLARPEVLPTLTCSPKEAADQMVEVILTGLCVESHS